MKKIGFVAILFISMGFIHDLYGQKNKKDRQFKIEVPADWQKKYVLDAIEEIVNYTVKSLKEYRYCTNCDAKYTVKYQTSASEFASGKDAKSLYVFKGTLVVYDSTGKGISRIVLVNPEIDDFVFFDAVTHEKTVTPATVFAGGKKENLSIEDAKQFFRNKNQYPEMYSEDSFLRRGKDKVLEIRENVRKLDKQRGRNT